MKRRNTVTGSIAGIFSASAAVAGMGCPSPVPESCQSRPARLPPPGTGRHLINLSGGRSHMDTFDLKPDAPRNIAATSSRSTTNVPGMQICEHLPKLAQVADKYRHPSRRKPTRWPTMAWGALYMNTGNNARCRRCAFPAMARWSPRRRARCRTCRDSSPFPNFNGADSAGYLGVEYGPMELGSTPQQGQPVRIRGLTLNGNHPRRIDRRQNLLSSYDNRLRQRRCTKTPAGRHGPVRAEGLRHDAIGPLPRCVRHEEGIGKPHHPSSAGRLPAKLPCWPPA